METESLTEILVFWGTITGIVIVIVGIANFVRRMHNKNDQPKLVCKSDFSFKRIAGEIQPQHKLILRSDSNRPITVIFVRYYIKPRGFWRSLFKEKTWEDKRWIYDDKPRKALYITEEHQAEISVNLPIWVTMTDVLKVEVFDQSGKAWAVKWPSSMELAVLLNHKNYMKLKRKK
ncbi:MAG: hypothetical protein KAI40_01725 [Desulfobacterales bacterium]|nr:hypothetical protein [Desulfobacterales bacterium]